MTRSKTTSKTGSKKRSKSAKTAEPPLVTVATPSSYYELAVLGSPTDAEREALASTLQTMVAGFGLQIGREIVLRDHTTISSRNKYAACAAVFFGSSSPVGVEQARVLASASIPIIPTVSSSGSIQSEIPNFLQSANGLKRRADDPSMVELATALLECVGLLRKQRRVFISYRRTESRAAAMQLHDLMAARGFDVFLDTHDIRPGDPFQDVLWHRLCDSDVTVMLDTPGYFDSRWTKAEIARARAKEISILRVIWPDHTPNRMADLAQTVYLDSGELVGADGPIVQSAVDDIVTRVEALRSQSIASRYMSITGRLRTEVERIGATIQGIGAHRAISIRLDDGRVVWAYPIVGIPTAEMLNEVSDRASRAEQEGKPALVYDHVGIRDGWIAHLKWLDQNITAVRAIKVSEAGWDLGDWV